MSLARPAVFAELPSAFVEELGEDGVVLIEPDGTRLPPVRGIVRLPQEEDFAAGEHDGAIVEQGFARLRQEDCPNVSDKWTLEFDGVTFEIQEPRNDGRGMTHMDLKKT